MSTLRLEIAGAPCIVTLADGPFTIDVSGKEMRFELDGYRGAPWVVGRNGEPLKNQPGGRNPFWRSFGIWCEQGRKMDGTRCLWTEPPPNVIRRIGRNAAIVVSSSDSEYARTVEETPGPDNSNSRRESP